MLNSRTFTIYLMFIAFNYLIFRMLTPFGSEPDFLFRVEDVLNINNSIYSSFLRFFYNDNSWVISCEVTSNVTSFFNNISSFDCGQSLSLLVNRWLLYLLFFILSSFITFVIAIKFKSFKLECYSLLLSYMYPSILYYLGAIGLEQLALFFSLFLILSFRNKLITLFICIIVFSIESGSFIVILYFICILYGYLFLASKKKYKLIMILSLLIISFSYALGLLILKYMYSLPIIGAKATVIFDAYSDVYSDVSNKYSLYLRPVITFFTGTFMTSDGIKSIPLFLLMSVVIFKISFRLFKLVRNNNLDKNEGEILAIYFSIITMVCSLVFILPGFANAKYYVFTIPFLYYISLNLFNYKRVLLITILSTLLVNFQLILARLEI